MSQAQELLKALSKILRERDNRTSKLAESIVAVLEIERKQEQNRIIKLLDQKHNATYGDKTHNESGNCTACEVIALIKGENK